MTVHKNKLFESLPRQSTVDQLKRIRKEINKSQKIKIGPDESTMKGDVGDKVTSDLIKHKGMNNLFYWDNPLDRHIDSYETFVKDDSRGSLGYTKKGDTKIHKGTDYVKESINSFENKQLNVDPYNEEIWEDDEITKKIKERLKEFVDIKYTNKLEKFFEYLSNNQSNVENIYEILEFDDSMFSLGSRCGIVKARSQSEAKSIFVLTRKRKDYIDILLTGYYGARIVSQENINKNIEEFKKELIVLNRTINNCENPKGINDI